LITGGLTPPMQKAPVAPPGFSLRAGFFIDHMGACLSWRPLSFHIQNHFNTIATQKMAIPSTINQPVI
jgi:hypothetical protein